MPPPVPRCSGWASSSLISPDRISLPRYGGRVGLHIDLFGACSAFTRVAACTLAQSPIVTANRRLQPFRYLHDCSDCFRLERSAGWGLHPLESAAFARRTPIPVVPPTGPARPPRRAAAGDGSRCRSGFDTPHKDIADNKACLIYLECKAPPKEP